jgi:hypothetical protein
VPLPTSVALTVVGVVPLPGDPLKNPVSVKGAVIVVDVSLPGLGNVKGLLTKSTPATLFDASDPTFENVSPL